MLPRSYILVFLLIRVLILFLGWSRQALVHRLNPLRLSSSFFHNGKIVSLEPGNGL
jgi:hypothetical protein